jgi:hypothetical protein
MTGDTKPRGFQERVADAKDYEPHVREDCVRRIIYKSDAILHDLADEWERYGLAVSKVRAIELRALLSPRREPK